MTPRRLVLGQAGWPGRSTTPPQISFLDGSAHGGARLTRSPSIPRSRSVLIVDHSDESREVLRTVLERRGVSILEARQGAEGLQILRQQHPDVVVVDLENDNDHGSSLENAYHDESRRNETSLVVLGRLSGRGDFGGSQVISKPYHYGPLIRTIEQLLERH